MQHNYISATKVHTVRPTMHDMNQYVRAVNPVATDLYLVTALDAKPW